MEVLVQQPYAKNTRNHAHYLEVHVRRSTFLPPNSRNAPAIETLISLLTNHTSPTTYVSHHLCQFATYGTSPCLEISIFDLSSDITVSISLISIKSNFEQPTLFLLKSFMSICLGAQQYFSHVVCCSLLGPGYVFGCKATAVGFAAGCEAPNREKGPDSRLTNPIHRPAGTLENGVSALAYAHTSKHCRFVVGRRHDATLGHPQRGRREYDDDPAV